VTAAARQKGTQKQQQQQQQRQQQQQQRQGRRSGGGLCLQTGCPGLQADMHRVLFMIMPATGIFCHAPAALVPCALLDPKYVCMCLYVDPSPVHDVHEHNHAQPVCLINHRLQLLRGATPTAGL
jgi:hypothetical protein